MADVLFQLELEGSHAGGQVMDGQVLGWNGRHERTKYRFGCAGHRVGLGGREKRLREDSRDNLHGPERDKMYSNGRSLFSMSAMLRWDGRKARWIWWSETTVMHRGGGPFGLASRGSYCVRSVLRTVLSCPVLSCPIPPARNFIQRLQCERLSAVVR